MPGMVRVTLQDRESPVELLEQDYAGQLMSQCHPTKRNHLLSVPKGRVAESIGRADREGQGQWVTILILSEETGELFG